MYIKQIRDLLIKASHLCIHGITPQWLSVFCIFLFKTLYFLLFMFKCFLASIICLLIFESNSMWKWYYSTIILMLFKLWWEISNTWTHLSRNSCNTVCQRVYNHSPHPDMHVMCRCIRACRQVWPHSYGHCLSLSLSLKHIWSHKCVLHTLHPDFMSEPRLLCCQPYTPVSLQLIDEVNNSHTRWSQ